MINWPNLDGKLNNDIHYI